MVAVHSIQHHFHNIRALAQGVTIAGMSLGKFWWAPLARWLISLYTWKGAFWVIGAIFLNGVVLALLLRPKIPEEEKLAKERKRKAQVTAIMLTLMVQGRTRRQSLAESERRTSQYASRTSVFMRRDYEFKSVESVLEPHTSDVVTTDYFSNDVGEEQPPKSASFIKSLRAIARFSKSRGGKEGGANFFREENNSEQQPRKSSVNQSNSNNFTSPQQEPVPPSSDESKQNDHSSMGLPSVTKPCPDRINEISDSSVFPCSSSSSTSNMNENIWGKVSVNQSSKNHVHFSTGICSSVPTKECIMEPYAARVNRESVNACSSSRCYSKVNCKDPWGKPTVDLSNKKSIFFSTEETKISMPDRNEQINLCSMALASILKPSEHLVSRERVSRLSDTSVFTGSNFSSNSNVTNKNQWERATINESNNNLVSLSTEEAMCSVTDSSEQATFPTAFLRPTEDKSEQVETLKVPTEDFSQQVNFPPRKQEGFLMHLIALCTNGYFIIFCLAYALNGFGHILPLMWLPTMGQNVGATANDASWLVSTTG